jgi:hypothetical protein
MTQKEVLSLDVLSLRTFCPFGRFVPTDVLSNGLFVRTDVLSHRTFCYPDVLSLYTLCLRTLCLRTLCLRTFCLGTIILAKLPTTGFASVIFTVNNNDDNHADMDIRYLSLEIDP